MGPRGPIDGGTAAYAEAKPQWNNQRDETFPRSMNVDHQKVSFKNRYGVELIADQYSPKGLRGRGSNRQRFFSSRDGLFGSRSSAR